jgi:hypothetical protein
MAPALFAGPQVSCPGTAAVPNKRFDKRYQDNLIDLGEMNECYR